MSPAAANPKISKICNIIELMGRRTSEHDHAVGKHVAALRKAQKKSQTELGDAVGVSYQQIQKYESGVNRIGASRLRDIAQFLKVPVATFFGNCDGDDDAAQLQFEALDSLITPGAADLLRAFMAIEDDHIRREVLAIVLHVARISDGAERQRAVKPTTTSS